MVAVLAIEGYLYMADCTDTATRLPQLLCHLDDLLFNGLGLVGFKCMANAS